MAGWSEKITIPGLTRVTFRGDPAKMPAAVLAAVQTSSYWALCGDGFFYYRSAQFEGKTDICEELLAEPKPSDPVEDAFLSIYGAAPGPYAAKWVWQQARRTFVDDLLPPGLTRAGVTRITGMVKAYGLPGARLCRHRREEGAISGAPPAPADHVYHRVVFVHAATETTVRYLDWPAAALDDEKLDDTVRAWQEAIVHVDPKSFPKAAVIAPGHNAQVREMIERAQAEA